MKRFITIFALLAIMGCSKNYLDKKPDKSIIVPVTYNDLQSLLDNTQDIFNWDPCLGFIGSDDYRIEDNYWQYLNTATERNAYIWNKEIYEGGSNTDWNKTYGQVLYSNVILEQLGKLQPADADTATWNTLNGSALFYRGTAFFNLLQLYAAPFTGIDLETKPGIPLRLTANVDAPVTRASLVESYNRAITDLEEAVTLLPVLASYKTRPSKAAAFGMLARAYLVMRNYEKAKAAAIACLAISNDLMDYNQLDPSKARPIAQFNEEVIFHSTLNSYGINSTAYVDGSLLASYDDNDLRKSIFVNNTSGLPMYRGSYSGSNRLFSGISTNEMVLTLAECYARLEEEHKAMEELNRLLQTRFVTGAFTPLTAGTPEEALTIILAERRKELLFRNTRWTDLRRLNLEPDHAVTLERTLNGVTYTLPPNDMRYVYPIPPDEIQISGIEQNKR
jgi:SusD family.